MRSRGSFCTIAAMLVLGCCFADPGVALAQRHGGGHAPGSIPGGSGRPDGVDEKDDLKDFHQAMAVQASSQQVAEFQELLKSIDSAKTQLQSLRQVDKPEAQTAVKAMGLKLDQALDNARSLGKKFIEGFSDKQKSGLKEETKKLEKADSALAEQQKALDQILEAASRPGSEIAGPAQSLDKALTEFSNQQVALGREMGIVLASGQDLTFNLPATKNSVAVAGRAVDVTVSGALFQTAAQSGQRTFRLELKSNLSDLQRNLTELLRAQLEQSNACGERLAVQQAVLSPSTPASLLVLHLHFERWTCTRVAGQTMSNELAESDGSVDIKLLAAIVGPDAGNTPSQRPNRLQLSAEFARIDARGMMGDALRSGDLGAELREKIAQTILPMLQPAANLNRALPPAVRNSATLQDARFETAGTGDLGFRLEGQVQISDEQANLLASQLNQTLSAHETEPQPPALLSH